MKRNNRSKLCLVLLFMACILIISVASVSAATPVDGNTFTDLNNTIKDYDDISLTEDIICNTTEASNFTDGIIIDKNLTINGNGFVIDGNNSVRIFKISNDSIILTLINVSLINGKADYGGAIYANCNVYINTINVLFINNTAINDGGCIFALNNININNENNLTFYNNHAILNGGALYSENGSITINGKDLSFIKNYVKKGNGGALFTKFSLNINASKVLFELNEIINYDSDGCGGAIHAYKNVIINSNEIYFNKNRISRYGEGSAIYSFHGIYLNFTNIYAYDNFGTTFFTQNKHIKLNGTNAYFIKNFNTVICVGNSATLINLTGNLLFKDNYCKGYGGAINTIGLIINCSGNITFENNHADLSGGAVWSMNRVLCEIPYSFIKGENIFCNNNNADYCGGMYSTNPLILEAKNNIVFVNNTAKTSVGAIDGGNVLLFSNKVFIINNSANQTGAIRSGMDLIINTKFGLFNNNFAYEKSDIDTYNLNISNILFMNNFVNNKYSIYTKNITLMNCKFKSNSNYSVIYVDKNVDLGFATFINNTFNLNNTNIAPIIFNGKKILSKVEAKILDNSTLNIKLNTTYLINVTFYDDNGNIISILNDNMTQLTINDQIMGNLKNQGIVSVFKYNFNQLGNFILNVESSNLTNLTVKKSTIIVSDIELIVNNLITYYHDGSKLVAYLFDFEGKSLANKTITFTINGKTYPKVTNISGAANLTINLAPGQYPVFVSYGNLTKKVNVTVKSTIIANNIVKIYRNNTQYYAKFINSKGEILSNTNVTFNINGVVYTRITNASGIARLNINLNAGEYVLTAINPVTNEMCSNNITIISTVQAEDITKMFHNDTQYKAQFFNTDGTVLANTSVTFNINGVIYTKYTDKDGYAVLSINLNAGNYTITAYNPVTSELVSNNIEVKPLLVGKDLNKTFGSANQYEVTAYDSQGNLLAGANITINVNGVFYNRITDDNGVAYLNINLNPGKYIATAYYNDFATSNKINVLEA